MLCSRIVAAVWPPLAIGYHRSRLRAKKITPGLGLGGQSGTKCWQCTLGVRLCLLNRASPAGRPRVVKKSKPDPRYSSRALQETALLVLANGGGLDGPLRGLPPRNRVAPAEPALDSVHHFARGSPPLSPEGTDLRRSSGDSTS